MKPGYKQTEIGVIPEDWSAKQIKTFAKICMCKRVFADQTSEAGDIPFYKIGTFGGRPDAYISKTLYAEYKNKYSYPAKGDVLISAAGTLGRTVVFDGKDSYFQDSNIVWLDVDKKTICNEYLKHYYEVIQWAASEGSTISRLYNGIIESTYVAIPPLKEQCRIAKALTDMDMLIASLEKMIAKKKAIKQGVMQELLTAKRRLEGFNGEWKTAKLISCTERIIVGLATSVTQYYRDHGVTLFRNLNILPNRLDDSDILYLDPSFASQYSSKQIRENDVLTVHTGYVGTSCVVPQKYDGSLTFTTLITTTNSMILAPQYLVFHLNSVLGSKMIESLQAGGGRNNLNVSDFEQYELSFPKDIAEQIAISNVIAAVDKEIELLKLKQQKLLSCKQGMMQQLLTGTTRLI